MTSLIIAILAPQTTGFAVFVICRRLFPNLDRLITQIFAVLFTLFIAWFFYPRSWQGMELISVAYTAGFFGFHSLLAVVGQASLSIFADA